MPISIKRDPCVNRGSSVSCRLCLSVYAVLSLPDRYAYIQVSSTFCTWWLTVIVKPFSFLLFCFVSLGSRPQLMCVDQRKERAELLQELLKNGAGFDPLPVLTQVSTSA